MPESTDVLVVGGEAIGAAVAYFLRLRDPSVDVTVVERDPTYELASTPRASGGVRRLFSLPENIALSRFSIDFFEHFPATMAVDGTPAEIGFHKNGYLFIVPPAQVEQLRRNHDIQRELGCDVVWLEVEELEQRFPSMYTGDLGAAASTATRTTRERRRATWTFDVQGFGETRPIAANEKDDGSLYPRGARATVASTSPSCPDAGRSRRHTACLCRSGPSGVAVSAARRLQVRAELVEVDLAVAVAVHLREHSRRRLVGDAAAAQHVQELLELTGADESVLVGVDQSEGRGVLVGAGHAGSLPGCGSLHGREDAADFTPRDAAARARQP